MAIFVTGDVHGGAEYGSSRFSSKSWPDGRTLSRDDVVVVAGDFGFVWDGSNTDRYWLDWFESKPWTTCFVDGNHENHRMLAELPETEWNGGRVHIARPHVLHLMRGEVFDIAGTTVLAMGGAASASMISENAATSFPKTALASSWSSAFEPYVFRNLMNWFRFVPCFASSCAAFLKGSVSMTLIVASSELARSVRAYSETVMPFLAAFRLRASFSCSVIRTSTRASFLRMSLSAPLVFPESSVCK